MSRSRMFDEEVPSASQPSPRTTIVGGRPPEHGGALPPVPTGIQTLLRMASVDRDFLTALCTRRSEVAPAAGVALTTNERAILGAIPAADLELMATQLPPPSAERRTFLRDMAAAAVGVLGGVVLGCDRTTSSGDPTRPKPSDPVAEGGLIPPPPEPSATMRPNERDVAVEGGISPRPVPPSPAGSTPPPAASTAAPVPIRPDKSRPTRGITRQ